MKNGNQNRSQVHIGRAEFWTGHKTSMLISSDKQEATRPDQELGGHRLK